ncbi:hypothetical protein [Pseudomonas sp. ADAK13]|uniref:hypothetical protein n=1 Tax=Pseudomonas sp. ADAK13 TaxID=2730847 RepID=UPI001463D699|nr:hypothetical protein [Pseudomonas sp. ADAK13]QJI38262.1 hypothetical protein HKK54_28965 [Pseudomonas sp. ADAK13]
MSWEAVSCWIESHPGLASWVQAAGSIAAIFVAILIASRDSRIRRRDGFEMRRGALVRAIAVLNDSTERVRSVHELFESSKTDAELVAAMSGDLVLCQQNIKQVLASQNFDADIYTQVFLAGTGVEVAIHAVLLLTKGFVVNEGAVHPIEGSLNRMEQALAALIAMQNPPKSGLVHPLG